jgi:hypothetical protein
MGKTPMDVTYGRRPASWPTIADASVARETTTPEASDDAPGPDGRFVRGAMIGLIIVAPFWVAVAWGVVRLFR